MADHNAEQVWVVSELGLPLTGPPSEGEVHPETTPVGPFASREAADEWALAYIRSFGPGGGSWGCSPLRPPPSAPSTSPGKST